MSYNNTPDEPVIHVNNISKVFRIYDKPKDRAIEFFANVPRKILGLSRVKRHKEFHSLNNISLTINKGETIGIVGANGAGKSTLLQIICGTLTPTSGNVSVNGRVAALLELGAGFNPDFTGKENIFISASIMGLNDEQIKECYESIVEFSEIGEFIDRPVKTYSSGMFVRLAFSIIAHVDADILIVDEALSVGDAFFVQKCMRFLRAFMEKGTVLFVSHDTASIVNLCDRAVWIERGEKKMDGSAKDVSEAYLAALFKQNNRTVEKSDKTATTVADVIYKDMRADFINGSNLRNDIELFSFNDASKQFGEGGAEITDVNLENTREEPLSWVVGGEDVKLRIKVKCLKSMYSPIVGFYIKDRLGQTLFGDNTYISYLDNPLNVMHNENMDCTFEFSMPILPVGEYSICVAIAEGTQHEHIQHHWIHDAIIFKSHSSSTVTGLVGIPMKKISVSVN
ncbi:MULTISPECIES: ABC transporter ATP-binding protein [Enterobacterales]|uniref:Teichoic acid export ATP-binding protein n=1 Tax=Obesumbacterium proteus ATCC 12841 TaxID=1354268 RepID=A0AA91IMD7_9GAMM|nr:MULTISPECIES: ABC transporter ATP-binding protein [Enterobacterales]EKN0242221.1 ABC transporter ATP-binding protein [Citrobacter freundii]WGZ97603.1 ABC transporter ATP-binding protein [Klebsiella michiganensis]HEE9886221.1 ABC transporter ATP-binding protein [Citrobacter braakii]EJA2552661.1 ABC transporter ATP-binding protein [Serratia marcescens]EKU7611261.1 ABC transporter ATP-binding protein [Citrobacter freundii]